MKACNECHIQVRTGSQFCPLCGAQLVEDSAPTPPGVHNHYPDLTRRVVRYNFWRRLLLFISLLGCGISLLINFLVAPSFLWSLIVVAPTLYCWLTVPPLLRRGRNFAAQAAFISIFTCVLVVALDFIIGWKGWSVSYVLPAVLTAGSASIMMGIAFNRTNRAQYVLYQVLLAVFGFIPLLLYLLDIAQNLVLVLITACLALASLLGTVVFGDRSIKNEFKRRFHF